MIPQTSVSISVTTRCLTTKLSTIQPLDDWADNSIEVDGEKGCLAALAKLKRQHPHLRTLLSLGGASASAEFPALAANPEARETLARACREFVDRHEMDGIDG